MVDQSMLPDIIRRYETTMFIVNRRVNAFIRELIPEELTIDQFSMLRKINEQGSVTSSELAEWFCVGKSSITAIITRLADKGLLQRRPDSKDRRVTHLELTGEGKELTEILDQKIQEMLGMYLQHFELEEAMQFMNLFEKLGRVLSEPPEGSGNAT
ncbi:MarR family winged helix-turn-helix transcriptional regulator [Paenibacillus sp. SYP-B4298]|uniref:MarR family winged helix-turn-helix transcriptional regulator n=1 Tax=Paenibacillus sp. SYP-B4298 TaxID=2996034 RepID=UPI0022DD339B|nr:MarR family transcriptional regulator [Paenibacillus sp. SYP-B4298]